MNQSLVESLELETELAITEEKVKRLGQMPKKDGNREFRKPKIKKHRINRERIELIELEISYDKETD